MKDLFGVPGHKGGQSALCNEAYTSLMCAVKVQKGEKNTLQKPDEQLEPNE